MENTLQKIGRFLGKKFALIDEMFAKKTDVEKEKERAESVESKKVDKEEGKELMPSPSGSPGINNFLSEDGTWKEVNLAGVEEEIGQVEERINQSLSSETEKINTELNKKVDKVEGKNLSTEDYTSEEKSKLGNLSAYIKSVSLTEDNGEIGLTITVHDPATSAETSATTKIEEADASHNGLLSTLLYNVLKGLQNNGNYLDTTGTPSAIWQLLKNTGPKIKASGETVEFRNAEDSGFANITAKDITIEGNVIQKGDSFISEAEKVEVKDNILILNKGEVGEGVTAQYSGLEIDRGTQPQYKILFDESDHRFKAGEGDNLIPLMLRDEESNLTPGMFLAWDYINKKAVTSSKINHLIFENNSSVYARVEFGRGGILYVKWKNTSDDTDIANFGVNKSGDRIVVRTNQAAIEYLKDVIAPTFYNAEGKEVAYKDDVSADLGNYLPLAGGVMTGNIVLPKNDDDAAQSGTIKGLFGEAGWVTTPGNMNTDAILSYAQDAVMLGNDGASLGIFSKATVIMTDGDTSIQGSGAISISGVGDLILAGGGDTSLRSDKVLYLIGADGVLDEHNNKFWTAGNDGSGSGLDADLLDGKEGSEYALKTELPQEASFDTPGVVTTAAQTIGGDKTFYGKVISRGGFYDESGSRIATRQYVADLAGVSNVEEPTRCATKKFVTDNFPAVSISGDYEDGELVPQKSLMVTQTTTRIICESDKISFRINVTGNIYIDYGDGNIDTFSSGGGVSHQYKDGKLSHEITFKAVKPSLIDLSFSGNNATFIDTTNETRLAMLDVSNNKLTQLNVPNSIDTLFCDNNNIASLDLSNNFNLVAIRCSFNPIQKLDIKSEVLNYLYCNDCSLSLLNISSCIYLIRLDCSNNNLTSLDLSNYTDLEVLHCSNNKINFIELTNTPKLIDLVCNNNNLTSLNLINNKISTINCATNNITHLIIDCLNLRGLDCSNNKILSLDLSKNTHLEELFCEHNNLEGLNLSLNTELNYVRHTGNPYLANLKLAENMANSLVDRSAMQTDGRIDVIKRGTEQIYQSKKWAWDGYED